MKTSHLLLLLLLGLPTYTNCLKLPTYIKPCSRNDPNINACAKQHAILAIPQFINGDPKYKVPPLEPLEIEEMSLTQGSSNFGLSFTARNLIIAGLKDVQVKDIRIDLEKQHIEYDLFLPQVDVHCRYNVTGKVLILPITGSGDGELVFKNVDCRFAYDFDNAPKKFDDKTYLLPKNFSFTTEVGGMRVHLENLFNGDKFLGDNMNTFMNENWKELVRELASPIGEIISQVVEKILTNIFSLVPYDDAFPETV